MSSIISPDRAAHFREILAQHPHELSGLDDYLAHRLAVLLPHLVTSGSPEILEAHSGERTVRYRRVDDS